MVDGQHQHHVLVALQAVKINALTSADFFSRFHAVAVGKGRQVVEFSA